jgi:cell shape-determining protein MreC
MTQHNNPTPIPLYAVAIHNSIATGNLAAMKALVNQAEQHLKDHGNVRASVEVLKAEIAKLEAKRK